MAEITPERRDEILKEMDEAAIEGGKRRHGEGDKHALFQTIFYCNVREIPLPKWVDEKLREAEDLYQTGQLQSWDEIFGKPFPGKRRAGLLTRSRRFEIFLEAHRLKSQHEMAEDRGLFEQVAENLQIGKETDAGWTGWATVRDIYFELKKELGDRDIQSSS
jgi:hypothetical protein